MAAINIYDVLDAWNTAFPDSKVNAEVIGDTLQIMWYEASPMQSASISNVRCTSPDTIAEWHDGETPPRSYTVNEWLTMVAVEERESVGGIYDRL